MGPSEAGRGEKETETLAGDETIPATVGLLSVDAEMGKTKISKTDQLNNK